MTSERARVDLNRLATEIRGTLSAGQLGIGDREFEQLSQNIARAILLAVSSAAGDLRQQEPEFGEVDRPS